MADLYAHNDEGDDAPARLRLSVRWKTFWTFSDGDPEISATYEIGLFMGDRPLFCDDAYVTCQSRGWFYAESNRLDLIHDIRRSLASGETVICEAIEEWVKIVVGPNLLCREPFGQSPEILPDWYDVLVIVQHGGPWTGVAMGENCGPAMVIDVKRDALSVFADELLSEAKDLARRDPGIMKSISLLFPDQAP